MAGTSPGGQSAMATNKQLYGSDFPKIIGQQGGLWHGPKGFATNKELAAEAGAKGGAVSRRSGSVSQKQYKVPQCTYCDLKGHYTYSCELRQATMERRKREAARKRVEREEQDIDRKHLNKIASKYGVRRPW